MVRSLTPLSLTVICFTGIYQLLRCLVEVDARDVQGLPLLAKPAPRQNYAPMAGKPAPSSHESPRQWNQVPVTLIYQWAGVWG